MSKQKLTEKLENQQLIDTSCWPKVLTDNFSDGEKQHFVLKKKMVDMYMSRKYSVKDITEETGFHRNTITNTIKRCLELNDNGEPYGYTALIPYTRVKKYVRKADVRVIENIEGECVIGYAGAFTKLLEEYPELETFLTKQFLGLYKTDLQEAGVKPSLLHDKFINKCRQVGIKDVDYPLNTKDQGLNSIYRYCEKLAKSHLPQYVKRYGSDAYKHLLTVGKGKPNNTLIIRPFQEVQIDGHKIDVRMSLKYTTPSGDSKIKEISRVWIICLIDVATRVIIGYHICLNTEYSATDVLQCIQNAFMPKQKMILTIPELEYPSNNGYCSILIPETQWAIWSEIKLDNAKAHLANSVVTQLTQCMGCFMNFGPVATPERRAIIESFFNTLEERGYHRLPQTTGSNPRDPRRKKGNQIVIDHPILDTHLEEITEIMIANYNNTPHSGIENFAPLDLMRQRIYERGLFPVCMEESERSDMTFLNLKATRIVRGKSSGGRRPYIEYEGVEYTNDILASSPDMVGQKLSLVINITDVRVISAYFSDGKEFGPLMAKGKWSNTPHTLKVRKEINSLIHKRKLIIASLCDPIEAYLEYQAKEAMESKTAGNKIAAAKKLQRDIGKKLTDMTAAKNESSKSINTSTKKTVYQVETHEDSEIEDIKQSSRFKTLDF